MSGTGDRKMKRNAENNKRADAGNALKSKAWVLTDEAPFSVKEGYKALRTNVAFSLPEADEKVIGVTSAERAEGKSTNAINLGIAFSQILECDMRLPTIAAKLQIPAHPGMSDLMIGEASMEEVVHPCAENFDVIPAGRIPKDPTGMLASAQMANLITRLKESYDYVIVDLPPVTTVTDAAIMAKNIDGFLLVVRHQSTEFGEIDEMMRLLKLSDAKILGFVYNEAPVEGKKYYSHYYA